MALFHFKPKMTHRTRYIKTKNEIQSVFYYGKYEFQQAGIWGIFNLSNRLFAMLNISHLLTNTRSSMLLHILVTSGTGPCDHVRVVTSDQATNVPSSL